MRQEVVLWSAVLLTLCTLAVLSTYDRGWWWLAHPDRSRFPALGIDVSHHQGPIDWSAVAADDVTFAYVKATEGGDWTDARFAENWEGADAHGIARGAYHFFTLCRSAADQADHFIATVPADPNALPPVIDLEFGGNCSARPAPDALAAEVHVMVERLRAHYGAEPLLYVTDDFLAAYPLSGRMWRRGLLGQPSGDWELWQYRNRGHIAGIGRPVDLNVTTWRFDP